MARRPSPPTRSSNLEFRAKQLEMQLKGPALGLMISAVLTFLFWGVTGTGLMLDARYLSFSEFLGYLILMTFMGAISTVMFIGGLNMYRSRNYEWCMVSAIMAVIPWTGLAILVSIPSGIWALRTLRRESVKDAFAISHADDLTEESRFPWGVE